MAWRSPRATTSSSSAHGPPNIWRNSGLERGCAFPRSHGHWQDSPVEKPPISLLASMSTCSFGQNHSLPKESKGSFPSRRAPSPGCRCPAPCPGGTGSVLEPPSRLLDAGSPEFTPWPPPTSLLPPGPALSFRHPRDQPLGSPSSFPSEAASQLSLHLYCAGTPGPA